MVLDPETVRELRAWWRDEERFRNSLVIEDLRNRKRRLAPTWPEQDTLLDTIRRFQTTVAIKPRQAGFTTIVTEYLFARAYRATYPHKVLQTVNDLKNFRRVRRMVEVAYDGLPPEVQFGAKHNAERSVFPHNGAAFDRLIAGAAGEGRGDTYNDIHLTEMAFYPQRTSSRRQGDEEKDSDLLASLTAALHDEQGKVIIESTGNGPYGAFYRMVKDAAQGKKPEVGFVFIPWSAVGRYRRPVPAGWERTDEEAALARQYGLTDEQLAWRRWRMATANISVSRFQKEYPLTWEDPFRIADGSGWFRPQALNVLQFRIPSSRLNDRAELRVWEPPLLGRRYFLALDTSGGVGRDEAVIVVLRDDLVQVAQWQSNTASPTEQFLQVVRMASQYDALVLVEANKYGKQVLEKLEHVAGIKLWRDEDGRFYGSYGSHMGDTKREMMVHARAVIDDLALCTAGGPADPLIVSQLGIMVEKSLGNIEARDDQHDDRAIAFCLALFCARRYYVRSQEVDPATELQRKMLELARDHSKFRPGSA